MICNATYMGYFVYVLLCSDNSLYSGITNDLEKRMRVHQDGKGSKYVRSRLPFKVVYSEEHPNKSSAGKRENEIKHWRREKKIKELCLKI